MGATTAHTERRYISTALPPTIHFRVIAKAARSMNRSDQRPLSGCRVLLVEDNRETAESLREFLTFCGFQVMVAYTCQEGLETARKLQPHIVLCDINLPDSDGYVVASVLRQS